VDERRIGRRAGQRRRVKARAPGQQDDGERGQGVIRHTSAGFENSPLGTEFGNACDVTCATEPKHSATHAKVRLSATLLRNRFVATRRTGKVPYGVFIVPT